MFEYSFYLMLTWVLIYRRCLAWDVSPIAPTPFGFLVRFCFLFLFFVFALYYKFRHCILQEEYLKSCGQKKIKCAIEEVYSLEMFTTDLVFSYLKRFGPPHHFQ